ncbi:MAG: ThuA domain-containing protein [Halieaceae bacterium]|nr:ThuA domain-containing protein [Halieaceae bacterium]
MMTLNSQDTRAEERLRVLMTVGGVGYNTWIVRMLAANPAIDLRVRSVDDYQELFTPEVLTEVDAVLMYHRDNSAEAVERAALLEFLERGGGVVVLHHALANYADWEHWWQDQLGGLYILPGHADLPPSQYSHYFKGSARITRPHPVTERLGAFLYLQDESYDRLWVSEAVSVLLQTTAVGSDGRLAWVGPAPSQRVVYIQPGHDEITLIDPRYLMLLEDALRWTAR